MAKRVITVMREQFVDIEVDIPDDWTDSTCWGIDAAQLCKGLIGLDWETAPEYSVDQVLEATEERLAGCSGETSVS
jgi:ubiquinone biosynthesis protein Coq4